MNNEWTNKLFHKSNRLFNDSQYHESICAEIKQAVMISDVLSQFESASVNYNDLIRLVDESLLNWSVGRHIEFKGHTNDN